MQNRRKGVDWEAGKPPDEVREEVDFVLGHKRDIRTILTTLVSFVLPVFILFRAYFGAMEPRLERSFVVSLVLCYVFLRFRLGRERQQGELAWRTWLDWFLVLLSAGVGAYTLWSERVIGLYTEFFTIGILGHEVIVDVLVGTLLLVLVMEANRRVMGWTLVIFVGVFLLLLPLRPYLPSALSGAPLDWNRFIIITFSQEGGIFGSGTSILISVVFLFLMFGAIMLETRVGAFFTSLASSILGHQSGGPAKVAVMASGMLASISGSGIGNVATTGPITIPVMKAAGFKSHDAAAIETVASTGGGITPPIMGIGAFLMAEFLGIPYGKIILFAIVPALAYYLAVFASVHWKAKREGLVGLPKAELPSVKKVVLEGGHLVLPLIAMVWLLMAGYSISRVGFVAIIGTLLLSFVRKETRLSPLRLVSAMAHAARSTVVVSTCLILIGVVITVVEASGIGLKISMMAFDLSGGSLVRGLILAAIVAFIMGLPLPPVITYLYGVVFIVPALIDLGANRLAAHMFFFYYGIVGGMTPPVCVTAFMAAAIGDAPMMKTGWTATRLGFMLYLLPFLFVFNPALLLQGVTWADVLPLLIAFLGIIVCTTGMEGYLFGVRSLPERLLLLAIGLMMVFGLVWFELALTGIGILVLLVVAFALRNKKKGVTYPDEMANQ